jgi:UrcA family protein
MMETEMNIPLKAFAATLPFALAFGAANPAFAFDFAKPVSVMVKHVDLDLTTAAGRATLDHRIGAAVRRACGTASGPNLQEINAVNRCRAVAFGSARAVAAKLIARAAS